MIILGGNNLIFAIIQARMDSTRLPGKVLMNLSGKPVLEHIIDRLNHSNYINQIIVATSNNDGNDAIFDLCDFKNVLCFRGSEDDVLDRFYQSCINFNVQSDDILIRITADCPLIDYEIVDKTIKLHIDENNDYTSNTMPCTYPDGLDCEVFSFDVLTKSWKNANLSSEREHVTLYIRNHPEIFKLGGLTNDVDYSDLRWTLDENEDFILINEIYENLYDANEFFKMDDVLDLLKNKPELKDVNSFIMRNEGLEKSLKNDQVLEGRKYE